MKQLETIIGIKDFLLYKGEKVFVYNDKVTIGDKVFQKELTDTIRCANGLLLKEEETGSSISFYNGEGFENVEHTFEQNQYREIYAQDVFCYAEYDDKAENYKVVFSEHGIEYAFVNDCNDNLFAFFFNTKHQVLVFIHNHFHIFFSKTGEELWYLERTDNFQMMFEVDSFDPDSDGYIIKVTKNNKPYTICYNVKTGEVMWEHEDNHSLFFGGVMCEDGMRRGLLGNDGNSTLLFEMNPANGESEVFVFNEEGSAVKFEGNLNGNSELYYLYKAQGDKIYFVKNYTTYLVNDSRDRTVGFVDLNTKMIVENVCCTGFCANNAPIIDGDILYVFFYQPKSELLSFDFNSDSGDEHIGIEPSRKQLSGNYNVLLQGDKLVYVFEDSIFVIDIKKGITCRKFVAENSKYSPLTATINDGMLSLMAAFPSGDNNYQTESREFDIAETINEAPDNWVDVNLIGALNGCRGLLDWNKYYRLLFYKSQVYLFSSSEIVVVDLETRTLKERIAPDGAVIYPESTVLNGNMLSIYIKDTSLNMYYYDLDRENPLNGLSYNRFKPKDLQGEYQLGDYYARGAAGVPQSDEKAVEWYTKSAEHGHPVAQYELGNYYSKGIVVPQSYDNAVKWWTKSAMQRFEKAQYKLAECYEKGLGVTKNLIKAIVWYVELANKMDAAKEALLRLEKEGHVEFYFVYANRGDVEAQYKLALCYEKGKGVEQSNSEAFKWYQKAAESGHAKAIERMSGKF